MSEHPEPETGDPEPGDSGAGDPESRDIEPAGLGGVDFGGLLGMAQNMQSQMAESQGRLAGTVVEGRSGGGAVVIGVTGDLQFQSVRIAPEAIDPDDSSLLEDLVLAALRDATARVGTLQAESSPLAGLDLGALGLGGLLGGP